MTTAFFDLSKDVGTSPYLVRRRSGGNQGGIFCNCINCMSPENMGSCGGVGLLSKCMCNVEGDVSGCMGDCANVVFKRQHMMAFSRVT